MVEALATRVPEWIRDSDWVTEDGAEHVPDIGDQYWPDLVRALLPYLDAEVHPDQVVAYGETITLTPGDWRDYAGLIVGEDGTILGWDDS